MTIEVLEIKIINGEVIYTVADVSEERLQYIERTQMDDNPYTFEINYSGSKQLYYLRNFLKQLSKTLKQNPTTWGEATQLPVGRTLNLNQYKRF